MGSSLFARHYSGSRGFFPFLRVLRCFSSPACLHMPYVFRHGYARITTRRFPHSDILGSVIGQHLPQAFRSRPRPSSALGAKASTVCSCSLDRKELMCDVAMEFSRCTRVQPAPETTAPVVPAGKPAQVRSLKTQQRGYDELDILLGEPSHRTTLSREGHQTGSAPTGRIARRYP